MPLIEKGLNSNRHTPKISLGPKSVFIIGWVVWATVGMLTVGLLILGSLSNFELLQSVCTISTTECLHDQLSVQEANDLANIGLSMLSYASLHTAADFLEAIVFITVAVILFLYKSRDPMALFTSFFLFMNSTSAFLQPLRTLYPSWDSSIIFVEFIMASLVIPFCFVYPNGRFVPSWTLIIAICWVTGQAGRILFSGSLIDPNEWPNWVYALAPIAFFGSAFYSQFHRYRRVSCPVQRQQIKWFVYSIAIVFGSSIIWQLFESFYTGIMAKMVAELFVSFAPVCIPVAIGIAILRYRLWDIDIIINRSLLYGALTVSVAFIYVVFVGGLGSLLQSQGSTAFSLLAAGVVAILFQPLRERLQRVINRLTYGERDDPYAVISRLSRRLDVNLTPEEVMRTVVETIAQALKLPYVAVMIGQEPDGAVIASHGTPADNPLVLPLSYRGETEGKLILAPRSPGEQFSKLDMRLLEDLTRQAGGAVHSIRITRDLQRARERLITSREEERMRLRRDLHDGLGPTLASLIIRADNARSLIGRDTEGADAELVTLKKQVKSTIDDIRRLVYQLRPPILDELGLLFALQAQANQYEQASITFRVVGPSPIPQMPAAVEVAAYRIVQEALTNVVRHSGARICNVRIWLDNGLCLEVLDDGCGLPDGAHSGVGLQSMRERAMELGGHFEIFREAGRGTRIFARLPFLEG